MLFDEYLPKKTGQKSTKNLVKLLHAVCHYHKWLYYISFKLIFLLIIFLQIIISLLISSWDKNSDQSLYE